MKETAALYKKAPQMDPGRASLKDKKISERFTKTRYSKSKRSKACRHDTICFT